MNESPWNTPWKIWNYLHCLCTYPFARIQFALNGIPWGRGWKFYGMPIIQKHRRSSMIYGNYLQLRSSFRSNPLGPQHPVFLTTWKSGASLAIGNNFGMTGGIICAAESITIGDRVIVGANSSIIDTDYHPLDPVIRRRDTRAGRTGPIIIEDDVFIGMSCLILKGVTIGRGSVIGAGAVVSRDVPDGSIVAGNPARVVGRIKSS